MGLYPEREERATPPEVERICNRCNYASPTIGRCPKCGGVEYRLVYRAAADLILVIADNCDPEDATEEDAEIIRTCHMIAYPENFPDELREF